MTLYIGRDGFVIDNCSFEDYILDLEQAHRHAQVLDPSVEHSPDRPIGRRYKQNSPHPLVVRESVCTCD